MLKYTYINPQGTERHIEVKLLDTEFVNKWKNYLIQTSKKFPNLRWGNGLIGQGTVDVYKDPWPTIDTLFDSLKYLDRNTEFVLQHEDYNLLKECRTFNRYVNNITQHDLNRWHRYFTTLAEKFRDNELSINEGVNKDEVYQSIHNINIYVHALEYTTYPHCERRKPFTTHQYHYRFSPVSAEYNGYSPETNDQMFATEDTVMITDEFDPLTENFDYTVWLNEDILGKDQVKAWLDHDNLNEDDITGNLFMTPSIILDPSKIIPTVLRNNEFIEESKLSGKKFNRFPIGNIANMDEIDWANDFLSLPNFLTHSEGSKIVKIELDNEVLWETKLKKYIRFAFEYEPKNLLPRFIKWAKCYNIKYKLEYVGKNINIFLENDEDYQTFFLHWNFKRDTRCYVFCMDQILE